MTTVMWFHISEEYAEGKQKVTHIAILICTNTVERFWHTIFLGVNVIIKNIPQKKKILHNRNEYDKYSFCYHTKYSVFQKTRPENIALSFGVEVIYEV